MHCMIGVYAFNGRTISFALVPNSDAISSLNTKRRPVKQAMHIKSPNGRAKYLWTFKQKFLIISNSF